MHTQQLFAPFLVLFVKNIKQTKKQRLSVAINKAVSAAILRPAVCVSDVMNKAGMHRAHFLRSSLAESEPHGAQTRKQTVLPL